MKKVSILLISFLLMINAMTFVVNGTEPELVENHETLINTYGKIIEVKEPIEVVTGTVKEKVQEVIVEITEGDYLGDEFTTNYVLSYDIEGKILAYELDEGDKVSVQIVEEVDGTITVTVLDVVRANYIIVMFVLFLGSVVVIGGKKGFKAILGLL